LGVGLAVLGFLLLTYGRSGVLPHLGMLTFYQRVFVLNGFNMLPMPGLGLHVVFYLTFMAAIARGLFGDPEQRLVNRLLLYFGVFGSGALMYYVGRSHHVVLITVFSSWACAFVLLAYALAGELFGRSAPASFLQGLHPRGLLIGLGLLLCICQVKAFPNPVHQIARLRMRGGAPWPNIDPMMQFVRDHARAREKVMIIYPYGHLIAYQANVINVFPFVQGESLILRCQVDQVMDTIKRSEIVRVFGSFEPELAEALARFGFQPTGRVEGGFEMWEPRKDYGM